MNEYQIIWYNVDQVVKVEPKPMIASDEKDAIRKAYMLYPIHQTPGPLCSANLISK